MTGREQDEPRYGDPARMTKDERAFSSSKDWCECEHESHVEIGCSSTTDLAPVKTWWGTFAICKPCRTTHPIPSEYLAQGTP